MLRSREGYERDGTAPLREARIDRTAEPSGNVRGRDHHAAADDEPHRERRRRGRGGRVHAPRARVRDRSGVPSDRCDLAGAWPAFPLPGVRLRPGRDHDRTGHRRGGQIDRIRPPPQRRDRRSGEGSLRPRDRDLLPLRARRLPGSVRRGRPELRLSVPRSRVRLPGLRVGGPPPRPLDRFYTLVRDRTVLLGPRFSVNNQLRRFAPRDPGEPLDGVGQFLYPARFSTPPAPPQLRSARRAPGLSSPAAADRPTAGRARAGRRANTACPQRPVARRTGR
jgi:hypothetical protein